MMAQQSAATSQPGAVGSRPAAEHQVMEPDLSATILRKTGAAIPSAIPAMQPRAPLHPDLPLVSIGNGRLVVADQDYQPRMLYHGTPNTFEYFQEGHFRGTMTSKAPDSKEAFFFTDHLPLAENFTYQNGAQTGVIIPVWLRLVNPAPDAPPLCPRNLESVAEFLRSARMAGHDGAVFSHSESPFYREATTYAVFRPEQIISSLSGRTLSQRPGRAVDLMNPDPIRMDRQHVYAGASPRSP